MKLLLTIFLSSSISYAATRRFVPKSFKAEIVQVVKSSISGKIKKIPSSLDFKSPKHFRFEVKDQQLVVINPTMMWKYTPPFIPEEQGEVVVSEAKNLSYLRVFDVLRHGLVSNKRFKVKKEKNHILVIFLPKTQQQLGIHSARLYFRHGKNEFKNLSKISFILDVAMGDKKNNADHKKISQNKKVTTFEFNSITENVSFVSSHFIFTPPKNTHIIK